MAQYAMITETGLNEIDNAHPLGQYIEIAYYLPAYDYRIDPNILPTDSTISATEISTCTNSADTYPQGEILWNVSGDFYGLSTDQNYLVRTGSEVVSTSGTNKMITNFAHRNAFNINQFKTSAISDYYTADTVSSPGSTGFAWFLSNAGYGLLSAPTSAEGFGPEDPSSPEARFLYKGVTYQHVITSANDSRANFKVTMRAERGQIKFNKVGLYAVKRTADGVIAADPFLFGQVIIPEPQILYSKDVGSTGKVTEITLDFQIESKTLSAGTFENVFYSTSGDYWVRTTNEENGNYGLAYDGSVYITNTLGIDETGAVLGGDDDRSVAKLLVGTFEYVNKPITSAEKEMPQLCLQYVASQGIESKRIRTTMKTNVSGDCEFDMYGACLSAHPDNYSLIPAIDKGYGLGLRDKRWSHMYLSDDFHMYNDSWADVTSGSDFTDSYIHFNIEHTMAHFGNTNVYVGPYHNTSRIVTVGNGKYIERIENTNYVYGNISSYKASGTDVDGTYEQGYDLLVRSLNDIVMVTLSADNEDTFTAEEIISRIWKTMDVTQDNVITNEGLISFYERRISTLQNEISQNPGDFVENIRRRREIKRWESLIEKLEAQNLAIQQQLDESIIPFLGQDKDILLVAGRNIHTYGNVIPLRNLVNDLGWWDNQFSHVFTENITGWNRDDGNGRQVTIHSHLVPDGEGYKIKENGWTDQEWEEVTAKDLGRSSKYIERAYIERIFVNKEIRMESGSKIYWSNGLKFTKNSIEGNINNIGTNENRVKIMYLDDLVLTNKFKTYQHASFDVPYDSTNGIYYGGTNFYKPNNGTFHISEPTLRYSDITQSGILYLTLRVGRDLGKNNKTFYNDDNRKIMELRYSGILDALGLDSIVYSDITQYEQRQYIHLVGGGLDPDLVTFPGYVREQSDFSGLDFYANYNAISKHQKVKSGNGIEIADQDIIITFEVKGALDSGWSLE